MRRSSASAAAGSAGPAGAFFSELSATNPRSSFATRRLLDARRSRGRSSARLRVLRMSSGVAQPRRAIRMPHCTQSSALTKWESDDTTSRAPLSSASRTWLSLRSSRSIWLLISRATPRDGRVRRSRRPCAAGGPRAAAAAGRWGGRARPPSGSSSARSTRSVICDSSCAKCEWIGRHDDVELREAVVGEIERAVGEDVALDAGQQRQPLEAAVQGADARGVLERAALVEPVGHRQRLAVVGDGDVLVAEPVRRPRP